MTIFTCRNGGDTVITAGVSSTLTDAPDFIF